jgi:RNA polymerase sigma-70 factor
MAPESISESLTLFLAQHNSLLERLHAEAGCAKWRISRERFAQVLHRGVEKRFRGTRAGAPGVETYLKTLHLQDLALACACGAGNEAAWEFFVARYRPELRAAARSILRASGISGEARAEELADSLYAELYGVGPTGSVRQMSLFEYFHGRSKLSTWLRSVLAQRHVDTLRAGRRMVSLDAEQEDAPGPRSTRTDPAPIDPDRRRYLAQLNAALSAAFAGLSPRERMLLAFFYIDQLTLAEIGRTLREHESTVSRQLERTRRRLRELVTEFLLRGVPATDGRAAQPGLDLAQVELVFEVAIEDWGFDLSRALSKGGTDRGSL